MKNVYMFFLLFSLMITSGFAQVVNTLNPTKTLYVTSSTVNINNFSSRTNNFFWVGDNGSNAAITGMTGFNVSGLNLSNAVVTLSIKPDNITGNPQKLIPVVYLGNTDGLSTIPNVTSLYTSTYSGTKLVGSPIDISSMTITNPATPFTIDLSSLFVGNVTGVTYFHVALYPANPTTGAYPYTNADGTMDVISFVPTAPDIVLTVTETIPPVLTTDNASSIGATSAVSGGNITNGGGLAVTARGVCYSTSPNPTIADSKTTDGTGTGTFVSSLSGLSMGTTYYARAYATNNAGTGYGNEISFTTLNLATISTTAISSIGTYTANSGGNITNDGGQSVTARGVCWSTSPSPTIADNKTTDGTGTGLFTSGLTGLLPNVTYYIRAYATNSIGTSYGNQLSFTTLVALPTISTTTPTSITYQSASSGGNISNTGGDVISARGVCWSTSSTPTIADSKTSDGSGSGIYMSSLSGLAPNTQYYVRAYATNSAGTAYGNEEIFTTASTLPSLTTTAISSIATTTASSGGNVTATGGQPITARGICWSTSPNPTIANSTTSNGTGLGSFTSALTLLSPNVTYYVRAYATNSVGTAYGNEEVFTSLTAPATLTTTSASSITFNSASSGGSITDAGGGTITARGVCWSTSSSPTTADSKTTDGTGIGGFTSSLTNLLPNTLYFVRAYATNGAGTAYGNEITFTTASTIPSLTTTAMSSINTTTAVSGGNISSSGGQSVTTRGVCWSTSPNPTTADNITTDGTGIGVFVSNLSGLSPNVTYYVRAYAINSVGTAYGNEVSFTTLVALPALTTDNASAILATTATSGGDVTNAGGGTITTRGVCWSTSSNPTTADSKTINGSGLGTFTSSLTSLLPNTTYYVRAYATNSAGTAYGNEVTFTTLPLTLATITTSPISNAVFAAQGGGNISYDGGSSVTARGVCWSTLPNPTTTDSKTTNGTGIGSYSSNLTGLSQGTTYYARAYAINSVGTAYGNEISFTTGTCGIITGVDHQTHCTSYTWVDGNTYTSSNHTATYNYVGAAINGCDSLVTLDLTILNPTSSSITHTACDSYTLNGQTYTSTGTYTQVIPNTVGCDSTITLHLTINYSTTSVLNHTACDSYTLNGQTYTSTGTYTQVIPNSVGCDSSITLNLVIKNSTTNALTLTGCDSLVINGQTYYNSGVYSQLFTNSVGCDSTLTLNLTINLSTIATVNATGCGSYTLNGQTYTTSGTYIQHLTNVAGCDSTLTLNLTINHATASTLTIHACSSYTLNSQVYTTSGIYTQLITNNLGCDSTITLILTVDQPTTSVVNQIACGSYSIGGNTYTNSGTYIVVIPNVKGCDSTITLNLTIAVPSSSTITTTACGSYLLNGTTYTNSGTYIQHIPNYGGCDSTITLNLTVLSTTNSTIHVTACESFEYNGHIYHASGFYSDTMTNVVGCDSIVSVDLIILTPVYSTVNATACNIYTLNNQTYFQSGVYTQYLTKTDGCDSIITLNLTINQPTLSTLHITSCTSYTLNNQTYTNSGIYTQTITNSIGCDSIITLHLKIAQPSASSMSVTACAPYVLNGQYFYTSGVKTQIIPNVAGCDSVITLNLTIVTAPQASISLTNNNVFIASGGGSYQWIYCQTGQQLIGSTTDSLVPFYNGEYAVIATNPGGCVDTSSCILFTQGINEVTELEDVSISVYPNPSTGKFTIDTEASIIDVRISDVMGRLVWTDNTEQVDIEQEKPGVYIIEILTTSGTVRKQLIKE